MASCRTQPEITEADRRLSSHSEAILSLLNRFAQSFAIFDSASTAKMTLMMENTGKLSASWPPINHIEFAQSGLSPYIERPTSEIDHAYVIASTS